MLEDVELFSERKGGLEGELKRRLILFTESFKHGRGGIPSVTSVH